MSAPGTFVRTPPRAPEDSRIRRGFGLLFLWGCGVHVGVVAADPGIYRNVADGAFVPGIRTAWAEVFMAAPALWGLAVALGELVIAAMLLGGRRTAAAGLAGAVGFHVGLMLLGWGFWLWAVPAIALLLRPGRRGWTPPRRSQRRRSRRSPSGPAGRWASPDVPRARVLRRATGRSSR